MSAGVVLYLYSAGTDVTQIDIQQVDQIDGRSVRSVRRSIVLLVVSVSMHALRDLAMKSV